MEMLGHGQLQLLILNVTFVLRKSFLWWTGAAAKVLLGGSFGAPEEIEIAASCFAVN